MKHKRMAHFDTLWVLHVTGLACLGWLKQCRSNLGVCTSERSPKPGQASQLQQSPAKGKAAPPEAGRNTSCTTHQKLAPGIHSILVPPGISTPCSVPGSPWQTQGRWALHRQGNNQPTNMLVYLIFLHKAQAWATDAMRWAPLAQ